MGLPVLGPQTERTQLETACCLGVTQMAWDPLPACFPEVPGCGGSRNNLAIAGSSPREHSKDRPH